MTDYAIYLNPDGTLKGKAWGSWGKEQDTGSWYVTTDGLYCAKWSGMWAKHGKRCSVVYPGDNENEYIRAIVIGKKTSAHPSGVYRPKVVLGDQTGF